jgi:hypothetical protein
MFRDHGDKHRDKHTQHGDLVNLLIQGTFMRNCCDREQTYLEISTNLHSSGLLIMEKEKILICCVSVCMYVWEAHRLTDELLDSAWAVWRIPFGIQDFVYPPSVGVPWTWTFQLHGPQNIKWEISRKGLKKIWLNFNKLWRPYPKIKLYRRYFRVNNSTRTRASKAKCQVPRNQL